MTEPAPIRIIGGGLAGLSLGIALRQRGVPVTLFEAHRYPRHVVCGEFIAGVTPATIAALGIESELRDALQLSLSSWKLRDREIYRRRLPRAAIGISRYQLDQRLAEKFERLGGDLRCGERVDASSQNGPDTVLANGRQPASSEWLGLKIHCRQMALETDLELHLGDGAYVGLSKIEDGRVNVCGLFRKRDTGSTPKEERLLAYLRASGLGPLARQIEIADPDSGSAVGVAGLSYQTVDSKPHTIRVGDQSGLIAPFTGNGMSQAFEGAEIALGPICQYASGHQSWEATCAAIASQQKQRFARRRRIARWLHPWIFRRNRQGILAILAQSRLLPFQALFRLTH